MTRRNLVERIVVGGYPEMAHRVDAGRRAAWFGSYLTTILQRDVRQLNQSNLSTPFPASNHITELLSPRVFRLGLRLNF